MVMCVFREPRRGRWGHGWRPYQGDSSHVEVQQNHAHAAGPAPHHPLLTGGHRGPDGLVP